MFDMYYQESSRRAALAGSGGSGWGRATGGRSGSSSSSGKNFFRRVKVGAGRKSFLPAGVFYIFVSATKAIQILRKKAIQILMQAIQI
jgi:hypothetical protein